MKKFFKCFFLLLLCAAFMLAGMYAYDAYMKEILDAGGEIPDVASGLTSPIYALETSVSEQALTDFGEYEVGLDKEVVSYLKKHGGGRYTNSEGESVYVASTSSGGGSYSGGSSGGGSYYYDDDDDYYYSGSSGGGGGDYYDDGGSSGGGSSGGPGGYYISGDDDETEWNYCSDCGTWFIGGGHCPNPTCPSNTMH